MTRGLKFYPASHRYRLDNKWVPGVTTLIGVLDKPAIPKWAAGQVAEYVVDNPAGVEELRKLGRRPMIYALKDIPWSRRDEAGKRGNILHDYAEAFLNGQEVDVAAEHVDVMKSVLRFLDDWKIKPLLVEQPCASREHWWAGTPDFIAEYVHPKDGSSGVAIFDWKSGKALYPEYAWQLNAYAHGEFYGVEGDEHEMPKCAAAFGVQIRDDDYTVCPFEFGPHIYDEFVAIRKVHEIAKRGRGDYRIPGSGYVGLPITTDDEEVA